MKRFVVVGWVALAVAAAAVQVQAAGFEGAGVKAGVAVANLSGSYTDLVGGHDHRLGFSGGAFVTLGLVGPLALQPEVLYVTKGGASKSVETDDAGNILGTFQDIFDLDYLEIPVLVRVGLPRLGRVRPAVFAGPALDMKTSSRLRSTGPGKGLEPKLNFIEDSDFGLAMGACAYFGPGPRGILLDVRYTAGLADVVGPPSVLEAHNGVVAVMAGYAF